MTAPSLRPLSRRRLLPWQRRLAAAAVAAAALARSGCGACRGGCAAATAAIAASTVPAGAAAWPAWSTPMVAFGQRFAGPRELPAGLRYCRDFVTPSEEAELMRAVDDKGSAWVRHIRRAQQFFGLVYYQTSQALPELQPTQESAPSSQLGRPLEGLPAWLLPRMLRTGIFTARYGINQVQANEYLEDSGIGLHVEDPAAGPAFATLSLLQPVQFTLMRAVDGRPVHRDKRDREDYVKILLEPRSLLVLAGESRYRFAHAIRQSRLVHLRDGSVLRRDSSYRRVSLTFRGIVEEDRSVERRDLPEGYVPFTLPQAA